MRRTPVILSIALSLALSHPALAQNQGDGFAGPYLAARAAVIDGDHRAASSYFESAIAADPGNERLISNAIFANAALGQWARAEAISDMLDDGRRRARPCRARAVCAWHERR